jgi:PIN domain nuclease of toxin-antitoxin system
LNADSRLPASRRDAIRDGNNDVFLSVVSLWEIIIKHQLGKLPLPEAPETYIPSQREAHRIASLCVDEASVKRLASLPALHRDPFDRLLVCQALELNLQIATIDPLVCAYPVRVL